MTCYKPLLAWRDPYNLGKNGKPSLTFKGRSGLEPIKIPCGQCLGCRLERSRQWATRCIHEASLWSKNCFITLTFDDAHLSPNRSLNPDDFVKFMKRFRKRYDGVDFTYDSTTGEKIYPIRYFHCGEYGELYNRPHHHAIIFNFDFPDKELWQVKHGNYLYRSPSLESLWPYGFCTIGSVTFDSAAYVARYILKKVTGDNSVAYYSGKIPEYVTMSRRPGIARDWFLKYSDNIYDNDKVYIKPGLVVKPPRYYDKIYDDINPTRMAEVKEKRYQIAQSCSPICDYQRLNVRNHVKALKLKQLKRVLE